MAEGFPGANTANGGRRRCASAGVNIAAEVARHGWLTAAKALRGSGALLDIAIVNRSGEVIAVTTPQLVG